MICLQCFGLLQATPQTGRLNQPLVILSVGGHIIGGDLLHLMCRSHLQSGSPQLKDVLANLTDNAPKHSPRNVVLLVIVQFDPTI